MRVLHVASEVYPFSRTGGLADVMGALPPALSRLGLEVSVLSPWYASITQEVREIWREGEHLRLGESWQGGVRYLFLYTPDFQREGIYHADDVWRFSHWTRALPYALEKAGIDFDLLHGHDWVAGLAVAHAAQRGKPSVFTVHNLQYQGRWGGEAFAWTGLPAETFTPRGLEFYGMLNPLKGGLTYARLSTTVSPTYAREITTPRYGEGLEGVLQELSANGRLLGIINGLDQERWNPRRDPDIQPYGDLPGKRANIQALRGEFALDDAPILACVSRLAQQKGLDLLLNALPELLRRWNVLLLGSGDQALEAAFEGVQDPRFRFVKGMNEPLAHRLYAGSDVFAMPSRFEPCGLSQMIALRYGSLPLARATGGLADTIPADTGFLFEEESADSLLRAAEAAEDAYSRRNTPEWEARVERAMRLDFSWEVPARQYRELYQRALA